MGAGRDAFGFADAFGFFVFIGLAAGVTGFGEDESDEGSFCAIAVFGISVCTLDIVALAAAFVSANMLSMSRSRSAVAVVSAFPEPCGSAAGRVGVSTCVVSAGVGIKSNSSRNSRIESSSRSSIFTGHLFQIVEYRPTEVREKKSAATDLDHANLNRNVSLSLFRLNNAKQNENKQTGLRKK
mmetsp:Transcript_96866/g.145099  ORF Transcript_96866/g.145099 Transcript_96866/m.145099 type:complete len:183 (-) Transcript_96866:90-638(-)